MCTLYTYANTDFILFACIPGNSSLEPLLKGLLSYIYMDLHTVMDDH